MIWTSYFSHYKGENGVSVANGTPSWVNMTKEFPELCPEWKNVVAFTQHHTMTKKEFRKGYIQQLKQLDVHKYAALLNNRVLCCWENIDKDYCHRLILLEWFQRNGYPCGELRAENENRTCFKCKHSDGEYMSGAEKGWLCKKHGDAMTREEAMCQTCENWRYFA